MKLKLIAGLRWLISLEAVHCCLELIQANISKAFIMSAKVECKENLKSKYMSTF